MTAEKYVPQITSADKSENWFEQSQARIYQDDPQIINTTIMFVDLMDSVGLSNSMSIHEYDSLIDDFHHTLKAIVDEISDHNMFGEYTLAGDQLCLFLYDRKEVELNALLNECTDINVAQGLRAQIFRNKQVGAFLAIQTAFQAKNAWISYSKNVERIRKHQSSIDLAIGINHGKVMLKKRFDGENRIEGYAINIAKRIEGLSRLGKFTNIFTSKSVYDLMRGMVINHIMVKQRVFFERYDFGADAMKGISRSLPVFEIKFFYGLRYKGYSPEDIPVFERIFRYDPTNMWSYTILIDYYFRRVGEEAYKYALKLAELSLYSNPPHEKIYYDLANINEALGNYDEARIYCKKALDVNPEFDFVYEILADIEIKTGGDLQKAVGFFQLAQSISPGSPAANKNLAKALLLAGDPKGAKIHLDKALSIYPEYPKTRPQVAEIEKSINQALGLQNAESYVHPGHETTDTNSPEQY